MAEYGQVVGRGFGEAGQWAGDTFGGVDQTIHLILPAAIPTWLVIGVVILAVGYWVIRR